MTDFELEMQYFDLVQKLIEEKKLLEETVKINDEKIAELKKDIELIERVSDYNADENARLKEQIKDLVINYDMCRYSKDTFINKVMSVINGR